MLIFSDEGTTPRAHLQLGMEHMMSSRLEMNRHEDSQAWEAPPQEGGTDSDKTLWMCFLPKYGCLPCRHDCTWPKRGTGLWGYTRTMSSQRQRAPRGIQHREPKGGTSNSTGAEAHPKTSIEGLAKASHTPTAPGRAGARLARGFEELLSQGQDGAAEARRNPLILQLASPAFSASTQQQAPCWMPSEM